MLKSPPPSISIKFDLERRPRIECDWLHEQDGRRILDWLEAHPDWHELLSRAAEICEQAKS